jgi:hypothetical protein
MILLQQLRVQLEFHLHAHLFVVHDFVFAENEEVVDLVLVYLSVQQVVWMLVVKVNS